MKSRGFTLIELLVVISIIGLLSSIVLAALNGSRDKGTIAASLEFDATIYHTTGDQIIGDWEFKDGQGSTLTDSSGNGKNGTLVNSPTWMSGDTPIGTNSSLLFNGSNQYVSVTNFTSPTNMTGITVSSWLKSLSTAGVPVSRWNVSGGTGGTGGFGLWTDGQWYVGDGNSWFYINSGRLADNKWHLYTFTYNGSAVRSYLDGKLVANSNASGAIFPSTDPLYLGTDNRKPGTSLLTGATLRSSCLQ